MTPCASVSIVLFRVLVTTKKGYDTQAFLHAAPMTAFFTSPRSHFMFTFGNRFVLAILAISVMAFTPPVSAQDSDGEAALEDFIHYALIANVEFANGNALALIRNRMSDVEFYEMVILTRERHERFDRAIGWAMFVVDLEPLATKLEERFEAGRTSVIRNADRLKESIDLLNGSTRQRLLAKERLAAAGEYAVPHLLRTLNNSNDSRTVRNVKEMLAYIG